MEDYEPETEIEENIENLYNISLLDEDYELSMKAKESFIEFKIQLKNIIVNYYYKSKYDLETINKLFASTFKGIKEVFNFFDKELNDKKVKLIKINNKNIINVNFKNNINLELQQIKLKKDEMLFSLLKEVNSLRNKLNSKIEKSVEELIEDNNKQFKKYINIMKDNNKQLIEYINIKNKSENVVEERDSITILSKERENEMEYIDELYLEELSKPENAIQIVDQMEILKENQSIYEEKIKEKENEIKELKEIINQLKQEKEKKLNENNILENKKVLKPLLDECQFNDNINLINNFNLIDANKMNDIKIIENSLNITSIKSVTVYKIKRNDKILYEIAYPDNKNGYNIIIYNLLLNKSTNTISNVHLNEIHIIKHYYDKLSENHILLTSSSDKSIKLWNISSYPISNILHIKHCFDGHISSPFCLMYNNEEYYIFGGSLDQKKNIWNKNGELIGSIEKSLLNASYFIESTYIDNKPYILLSGRYHSECYDYNNTSIKIYKSNNKNNSHYVVNLFKNNNKIYLISGDYVGNIIIFDFISTNEISSISDCGKIYSFCSINERYILVGNIKGELKVIDFNNKSIINNYNAHNKPIAGIEKIKINEKEEYIITYDINEIKLWK